jgi:Cu(I)/Ag(I) efflux system periplasmic protein CusF
MNPTIVATALFLAAVPLASAQGMKDTDMKNMPMKSDTARAHKATGVVKSVDAKKNTVMLAHDPVASLNWPAMTMAFKVEDPKLVQGLTVGKKVEVEFTQRDKEYVITSIK